MFADYKSRCSTESVKPGNPYLWDDERVQILNFPTKRHWRDNSLVQDIELGLAYLAEHYAELGIHSIAMPPLGCGNGGLDWSVVKPLITRYLSHIPDLEVFVYEPQIAQRLPNQLDEKQDSSTGSAPCSLSAIPPPDL